MFALGIDDTVVNVPKDAIWIREAALPDTANNARPDPQWMINQEQAVRDLEIKPAEFAPEDQRREWVREFPQRPQD